MELSDYISVFWKLVLLPVAAAIIGAIIKGRLEDRRLFKLQEVRKVSGKWVGRLKVTSTRDTPERIIFFFDEKRAWHPSYWLNPKLVTGRIEIGEDRIEFRGGYCTAVNLLLDYQSARKDILQFGSILFKVDSGLSYLEGWLIGFYDGEFFGRIELEPE